MVELWTYERIDAAVDTEPLELRDYAFAVSAEVLRLNAALESAGRRAAAKALSDAADEHLRLHSLVRTQQWSWRETVSIADRDAWKEYAELGVGGWLRARASGLYDDDDGDAAESVEQRAFDVCAKQLASQALAYERQLKQKQGAIVSWSLDKQSDGTWEWWCTSSAYGAAGGVETTRDEAVIELVLAEAEMFEAPFPPLVAAAMRERPAVFARDYDDAPLVELLEEQP